MTTSIPDLWSEDIAVEVLTPYAILRAQCDPISRKTKGVVKAEVEVEEQELNGRSYEKISLVIDATVLGYREELLTVSYRKTRMYPCIITMPEPIVWVNTIGGSGLLCECENQTAFIQYLGVALRSPEVNGTILTLIARSMEKNPKAKTP